MCYDIAFSTDIRIISDAFPDLKGLENLEIDFQPTFHKVGQGYPAWPIVLFETVPVLVKAEWGVIPGYMNTPEKVKKGRKFMLNARSEKILDKSSYWYKIRRQRCLIPVTGYFEHREVPGMKKKVPYYIKVKDQELTFIAGLWTYAPIPDIETGEARITFTLITQPANDLLMKIHNSGDNPFRMPDVLPKQLQQEWMEPQLSDEGITRILSYQVPSDALETWPVESIRCAKDDDENVIAPVIYEGLPEL